MCCSYGTLIFLYYITEGELGWLKMEGLLAVVVTNVTTLVANSGSGSLSPEPSLNIGVDHYSSTITSLTSNATNSELDRSIIERFASNRRVTNEAAFIGLITAYCLLIVVGTIGNSLVVYVVAMQPAMRTARNVFVFNLAVSDLLLCLITMPLTVSPIFRATFSWFMV